MVRLVTILLSTAALVACGEAQTTQPNTNAAKAKARSDKAFETADTDSDLGQNADAVAVSVDSAFALFCTSLPDVRLTDLGLQEFAGNVCTLDGAPTKFFAVTMPSKAYAGGTADVALLKLADTIDDKAAKTTTMKVAGAVKLPVSAKKFFDNVTAFMDDTARARELGIKIVDGVVEEETLQEFPSESTVHVKGWEKRSVLESKVSTQVIRSEYQSRADHWQLADGRAYLVSNYLTQSIKGVKGSTMFAAIVQDGNNTYLLAEIMASTDNRGVPSVARDILVQVFRQGLKNMYENGIKIKALP